MKKKIEFILGLLIASIIACSLFGVIIYLIVEFVNILQHFILSPDILGYLR